MKKRRVLEKIDICPGSLQAICIYCTRVRPDRRYLQYLELTHVGSSDIAAIFPQPTLPLEPQTTIGVSQTFGAIYACVPVDVGQRFQTTL